MNPKVYTDSNPLREMEDSDAWDENKMRIKLNVFIYSDLNNIWSLCCSLESQLFRIRDKKQGVLLGDDSKHKNTTRQAVNLSVSICICHLKLTQA